MANEQTEKKVAKKAKKERKFQLKKYLGEMNGEVKKLTWLSKKDLAKNTAMVLVFVLAMSLVIWVLDMAFSGATKGLTTLTHPAAVTDSADTAE